MQHGTSVTSCQSSYLLLVVLLGLIWLTGSLVLFPGTGDMLYSNTKGRFMTVPKTRISVVPKKHYFIVNSFTDRLFSISSRISNKFHLIYLMDKEKESVSTFHIAINKALARVFSSGSHDRYKCDDRDTRDRNYYPLKSNIPILNSQLYEFQSP